MFVLRAVKKIKPTWIWVNERVFSFKSFQRLKGRCSYLLDISAIGLLDVIKWKTKYTTVGTSPEIKSQIYHSRNKSRNQKSNIPHPEQVQKSKIKYTTAGTSTESKIKYRGKTQIDTSNTQIHDPSHCGIGTGSSIKVAGFN